ncbi:MAG: D-alanyl-D-alanine carboxypeptidase [Chloroflexota bacterium]|nr:D-alanyl-D-alanine carboxypeptidase [Chloroflexota bacterium]
MDLADGRILFQKEGSARRAIASTTKVMTAIVVIENTKPEDMVTASSAAEIVGADDPLVTELELTAGERLSVEDLLYGLLLPSANDAAVALAEHVGGSIDGFSKKMNETAKRLGAVGSNFNNPHGFDDPNHYSTANDLAIISRFALGIPMFRKITATRSAEIPRQSGPPTQVQNRNQLLGSYSGATGIKTGQTKASGKSLIASAGRGGEERIAVVLDSPDTFGEASRLLDFGFNGFKRHTIATPERAWGSATYGDGTTVQLVPRSKATVLLEANDPEPEVSFEPRTRRLTAVAGGTRMQIPVRFRCSGQCRPSADKAPIVEGLWRLFAPIAKNARD